MAINQIIVDGFDKIIEEKGNTYVSLRKCKWKQDGEERYDLRKYTTSPEGNEVILKGVSLTEEGMNELTNTLVKEGFGNTGVMMDSLVERKDFPVALVTALPEATSIYPNVEIPEQEVEPEIYDIRRELL